MHPGQIFRTFTYGTPYGDAPGRYYKLFGMRFSDIEFRDLGFAFIILTIAFTNLYSRLNPVAFIIYFPISALAVTTGFFFHELAHKYVAQKYLMWAEFRANKNGLYMALLISIMGFIWAAPGAVYISGYADTKLNGKISISGPLTNIGFALMFIPVYLFSSTILFQRVGQVVVMINLILAFFNMLPILPLDGAKVLKWDKLIYVLTMGFIIMLFLALFYF